MKKLLPLLLALAILLAACAPAPTPPPNLDKIQLFVPGVYTILTTKDASKIQMVKVDYVGNTPSGAPIVAISFDGSLTDIPLSEKDYTVLTGLRVRLEGTTVVVTSDPTKWSVEGGNY